MGKGKPVASECVCEHFSYCSYKSNFSLKYGIVTFVFYAAPLWLLNPKATLVKTYGRDFLLWALLVMIQVGIQSSGWQPKTAIQRLIKNGTLIYSWGVTILSFLGLIHDVILQEYNGNWYYIIPYLSKEVLFPFEIALWGLTFLLFTTIIYNCCFPKSNKKKGNPLVRSRNNHLDM